MYTVIKPRCCHPGEQTNYIWKSAAETTNLPLNDKNRLKELNAMITIAENNGHERGTALQPFKSK
jgi:hypothetical protein